MARFFIVIMLASVVILGNGTAFSQDAKNRGEKIFTPLKKLRERAANGVLKDAKVKVCEACKLKGKLCPACACKRKERAEKEAEEKAKEEAAKEAELKKLEAEAKKAELEAKLLEEEDAKRNKPWDIADPENLESPSDLLKLAAASKQQQDLAPKKQEALNYLSQLGCIKDPNVEKAILVGLKDYNAGVRLAAIQAVIVAVRGAGSVPPEMLNSGYDPYLVAAGPDCDVLGVPNFPGPPAKPLPLATIKKQEAEAEAKAAEAKKNDPCDVCNNKRQRKKIVKRLCQKCRGKGCRSCGLTGGRTEVYLQPCSNCVPQESMVPCDACNTCNAGCSEDGCRSCCPSKEIMAELKRIAFEPDPQRKNCRYEPSIDVRNLALEALNICPKLEDKPIVVPDVIPETGGAGGEQPEGIGEQGAAADPNTDEIKVETEEEKKKREEEERRRREEEGLIPLKDGDTTTQGGIESPFKSVVFSNPPSRMLGAKLVKFLYNDEYMVEIDGDYLIPSGKRLYVQNSAGTSQIVEVIGSEVGFVKVTPIEGTLFDQRDSRLSIGIVQ